MEDRSQIIICKEKLQQYAEGFSELVHALGRESKEMFPKREERIQEFEKREHVAVVQSSLDEIAKIMTRMSHEIFEQTSMDKRKKNLIRRALRGEGIILLGAECVTDFRGRDKFTLTLATKKEKPIDATVVAEILSILFEKNFQISGNSPSFVTQKEKGFVFVEEPLFVAFTGYAKAIKDKETYSGDNYSFFDLGNGYLQVLLSDGTGSGEEANLESSGILDLIEKFLEISYPLEGALRLVNGIWTLRGREWNNPTLDVCSVNLNDGECEFTKIGAAVSYRKHGSHVELVEGNCLPMGCFEAFELSKRHVSLEPGDSLIMITDGILGGYLVNGEENGLCEYIEKLGEISPKEMAEKILQAAIYKGKGEIKDDMTVLVVRLEQRATT